VVSDLLRRCGVHDVDQVIVLLERAPRRFYCEACLAQALGLSRAAARDAAMTVGAKPRYRYILWRCDSCDRVTGAVAFVPLPKCARCSWPIADNDAFVVGNDEVFHHHCWRVLESDARIADSRQLGQSSRELVRRSLGRLPWASP